TAQRGAINQEGNAAGRRVRSRYQAERGSERHRRAGRRRIEGTRQGHGRGWLKFVGADVYRAVDEAGQAALVGRETVGPGVAAIVKGGDARRQGHRLRRAPVILQLAQDGVRAEEVVRIDPVDGHAGADGRCRVEQRVADVELFVAVGDDTSGLADDAAGDDRV